MLQAIQFKNESLYLIDQRELPFKETYVICQSSDDVCKAIKDMVVRGAPAIATAAAYGAVLDLAHHDQSIWSQKKDAFIKTCEKILATRPTAVNLSYAMNNFIYAAKDTELQNLPVAKVRDFFFKKTLEVDQHDQKICDKIGETGFEHLRSLKKPLRVLTHCNTGSLATSGIGTALGVIRKLHDHKMLEHVYVDETRPYLQGSRLTSFELYKDQIPFTLICDNAASYVMAQGLVDCVIVGADRIVANGDTANKIGTYSVAISAHYHRIPFYIAAPEWTFDLQRASGAEIIIEERPAREITHIREQAICLPDTKVFNPSFDITPNHLIAGFFTEFGVLKPPFTVLQK